MISEVDDSKTNEFLRRRKLRLQQVREQSKDIARKIRQRAKVENLRQVIELDSQKKKEYLQKQEQLVKKLEEYYANGLENVGASHRHASEVQLQDGQGDRVDLSKQRGKEAATRLRKRRQQVLDKQKEILDRKLQAREVANEISREKSAAKLVLNKQTTCVDKNSEVVLSKSGLADSNKAGNKIKDADIERSDMATQWELDEMPQEWEPNIPTLSLPKDDSSSVKESNNVDSKSDKTKKLDLFALSDEMPSSLRGNLINQEAKGPVKSSLTLVSEYLQNRDLRLREPNLARTNKNKEDFQSLKQTILRTRTSKEGNSCVVHDGEIVPVPSWQAEHTCGFCTHNTILYKNYDKSFKTSNIMELNRNSSFRPKSTHSNLPQNNSNLKTCKLGSVKPSHKILPSPVLRSSSPFKRTKTGSLSGKGEPIDKQIKTSKCEESVIPKKSLVTMYNHATRDIRDIPYGDEKLVVRNLQESDDAYSQAMKESTASHVSAKDSHKKVQEIRSKVAVAKQNVEKEYRDTISFLNSLPKDKGNKPIKTAYMDEQRQQMQKDLRQQKLQQEYKKIERECNKHSCKNKLRPKSRSVVKDNGDVFDSNDFQYSWMPVPESDENLAIHTIPTNLKEGKNSVQFSKIDSYHEYRSRHKHTPPTKQSAPGNSKPKTSQDKLTDSSDSDSASSLSSVQSVRLVKKDKPTVDTNLQNLSDAERIIIYKILDSKADDKKTCKFMKSIAKSLTLIEAKTLNNDNIEQKKSEAKKTSGNVNTENLVSFEQINEGVYKTVNVDEDNIASMYFEDRDGFTESKNVQGLMKPLKHGPSKCRKESKTESESSPKAWDSGDEQHIIRSRSSCGKECKHCRCTKKSEEKSVMEKSVSVAQPSATTSTSSFKTASNDKSTAPDGGFIKLIDDSGQETGKFFIGASGLLNNDAYEVVIQLRKKGDEKEMASEKLENKKGESLNVDKVKVVSSTQTCLGDVYENKENKLPVTEPIEYNKTEAGRDSVTNAAPEIVTDKTSIQPNNDISRSVNDALNTQAGGIEVPEKSKSTVGDGAVASNASKSQVVTTPRPATSTHTQTSMNSPSHRPVFFHMSSSTSTAYMSPPEFIIPKFMKPGYNFSDDEMFDSKNYALGEVEVTEEHAHSMEDTCLCRTCRHVSRLKKVNHVPAKRHRCRKSKYIERTPPNTARTDRYAEMDHVYYNQECDNIPVHGDTKRDKKTKCLCSKCTKLTKSKHAAATKLSAPSLGLRIPSSTSSFKKGQIPSKRSKANIKPIIKNYVDKLLALNKESLKAIEIVDQGCSSVTTPGSSVIEVSSNLDQDKVNCVDKLSLQQFQVKLKRKNAKDSENKLNDCNRNTEVCYRVEGSKHIRAHKMPRKKTAHKVKSMNCSRKFSKTKTCERKLSDQKQICSSSSTKGECERMQMSPVLNLGKARSKSSPTPRLPPNSDTTDTKSADSEGIHTKLTISKFKSKFSERKYNHRSLNVQQTRGLPISESSNRAMTSTSIDSDKNLSSLKKDNIQIPMTISTQTSINVDSEMNYMTLAEDKLQNMEKIADLTEKCTKRLSNLAKALEEVRKNKAFAYNHITTSDASDSDHKSDKDTSQVLPTQEPSTEATKLSRSKSPELGIDEEKTKDNDNNLNSTDFIPFLSNIPKPLAFKNLNSGIGIVSSSSSSRDSSSPVSENRDQFNNHRAKPPPALSRIHLKHGQNFIVPHELSTVIEVDSPMSVKLKSSRNETKLDSPEASNSRSNGVKYDEYHSPLVELKLGDKNNPDLLDSSEIFKGQNKISTNNSKAEPPPNNSKLQMIDIDKFNEIMLKPFFSIQEYAKQCNIAVLEDGSNLDDFVKDDRLNDELSSLHSEASLPDVISELLKRNIISEPFKFDTGSNANSTTVSSESTISMLALSKAGHRKNSSSAMFHNNDNIGETSDTISFSSNPDLENAFKKLGMGWASSTLKKTKERLALSSSSNTSSSSLSHFKVKSFNQDFPVPVTDTVSSVLSLPNRPPLRNETDNSKNAEQQTSKTCTMTVKEFLTKELAKKITFNNKSINANPDEYVTLYETKMPEQMKHSSLMVREENHSIDNSLQSGNNNRARTSTPVQLYRSMTYHSSSSSNLSNGLFSNVEDLSSVKATSNSLKHSTSEKDDLIIPNFSLRIKKTLDRSD